MNKKSFFVLVAATFLGGTVSTFIHWAIYKYCFQEDISLFKLIISFVFFVIPMFFVFLWLSKKGKSGNIN